MQQKERTTPQIKQNINFATPEGSTAFSLIYLQNNTHISANV
jgi:hypothetical protein